MSDIDLDKALDALADYADLVWDATDMQDMRWRERDE